MSHQPTKNLQQTVPTPRSSDETRCFADWALREVEHLLRVRAELSSPEERVRVDLQLAVLCDAAERYGRSLTEAAEL